MQNDQAGFFGERTAAAYDELNGVACPVMIDVLAELAGSGRALELAIGTGRVALPLAARGIRVEGIDISPAMVARLRAKPGGDALDVRIGDFADVAVDRTFALVYVVFNTLFNLGSQDDQVRCFENVAAHLEDDGVFVVETYVPSFLHRLRDGQYVDAEAVTADEVRLDVLRHDPAGQRIDENHISLSVRGVQLFPVHQRYAWPSELDLMARIAGLRLRQRWADWTRAPFIGESESHVSVWGR